MHGQVGRQGRKHQRCARSVLGAQPMQPASAAAVTVATAVLLLLLELPNALPASPGLSREAVGIIHLHVHIVLAVPAVHHACWLAVTCRYVAKAACRRLAEQVAG